MGWKSRVSGGGFGGAEELLLLQFSSSLIRFFGSHTDANLKVVCKKFGFRIRGFARDIFLKLGKWNSYRNLEFIQFSKKVVTVWFPLSILETARQQSLVLLKLLSVEKERDFPERSFSYRIVRKFTIF